MIEEDMKPSIDTIEAGKVQTAINLDKFQEETRRCKNKKVKPRDIEEGDLVLRRIPKAKQKRQDAQQVGRTIYHRVHDKTGGLQTPHARRHRRPFSWNKDMQKKYYV